jgi:phage shock protein C
MNKLYRSRNNSIIAGVCGGLGNYFGIDPTILRLLFVFLAFYHFLGVWVYLVMLILMPQAPEGYADRQAATRLGESGTTTKVLGGGLVILGLLALVSTLNIRWLGWLSLGQVWPVLIVLLGVVLLARSFISED